jgi:uncharacterized protein YbjT (DUF2867 family)
MAQWPACEQQLDQVVRPRAPFGADGFPDLADGVFGHGRNPVNFVAADDVARFVELGVVDPSMEGSTVVLAGPQDLTFDQFTAVVAGVTGRPGRVDHTPRPMLRLMSMVLGPIRPVMAQQIRTAIVMDTHDLRSDPGPRHRLAPSIPVTPLAEVARREFAAEIESPPAPPRGGQPRA